jgi:hypothetical protein
VSKPDNNIILYQDENGITNVNVRFSDEDVWLTQLQIAEIYDTTQPNISMHIDGIIKDGELPTDSTHKKFLLVQTEGKRQVKREISHYNLDMIIAIGYRVQSQHVLHGQFIFNDSYANQYTLLPHTLYAFKRRLSIGKGNRYVQPFQLQ